MKKRILLSILSLLICGITNGQNKMPKISGTVKISVEEGTIEANVTLSDYSHLNDYLIRLNSGLNILNIESLEPNNFLLGFQREFADSLRTYETISYYFPATDRGEKFLPSKLKFRYAGKFPVINDTISNHYQTKDWKGNIVFMNGLLRLDGVQSTWLPTLYDVDNDYQYDLMNYDLEIVCKDCQQIYLNGCKPINGQKAHFTSKSPKEAFLFVGNYQIQKAKYVTALNAKFSETQLIEFDNANKKIIDFLSTYTNIPYNEKIHWVQAYMSAKDTGYFAFASNPTFVLCGNPPSDLKTTFNEQLTGDFLFTIAHELSHYYFGTIKPCNNTMEILINEGFAEFLAMKYAISLGMDETIKTGLINISKYVNDDNFIFKPMGEIQNLSDFNNRQTYAYEYQVLVLACIEKEIGEDKMQKWIRSLLIGETPVSNKEFFQSTLKKVINNDNQFESIKNKYLIGSETIKYINETIRK
ncbi:M1 family aminopeptidase [Marinifilum fragile]|uniref:M1 family aminopeptidase n=1 Tax=Marinifilum fragile TaxID=570161 RepID=UPI002AA7301E|nr:M1 family aminopeptidase [Marinifilum fragile]